MLSSRPRLISLLCALVALCAAPALRGQSTSSPSSAATPPMGWNSWSHFANKVDDATVHAAADALVSSGMRDGHQPVTATNSSYTAIVPPHGVILLRAH